MSLFVAGRVYRFGPNVDTDAIIPGQYLKLRYEEAVPFIMAGIRPGFAQEIARDGGIIVAEENFGCGSSREAAPAALKYAGIRAVIAPYFARIFFRNAINVGLPVIECEDIVKSSLAEGEQVAADLSQGKIMRELAGEMWRFSPLPPRLQEILDLGGLVPYLKFHASDIKGEQL